MQTFQHSRRRFLQYSGLAVAGLFLPGISYSRQGGDLLLYVGTYTSGDSVGIYRCRFQPKTGKLNLIGETPDVVNPSYLAIAPGRQHLYAVNETGDYEGRSSGAVSAFAINQDSGELTFLNQQASRGAAPCYVSTDDQGKWVLVANYNGGNLCVLPVDSRGGVGEPTDIVQHTGTGVNPQRQKGPHAHSVLLDPANRYALSADLGIDKILIYRFDGRRGRLLENDPAFAKTAPGAGPRHIVFHPNGSFVYVIDEMGSTIMVFGYDAAHGELAAIQTVSTLPDTFRGSNTAADIHVSPDGRFLYGSNRGHDSLAVFSVHPSTGKLSSVGYESTRGHTPRNFTMDPGGNFLLAANQNSDSVVIFRRNLKTGTLSAIGDILRIPSPVCLTFL